MPRWTMTLEERFWSKVDRRGPDECWPWMACLSPGGYGRFNITTGRAINAHRMAHQLHHGITVAPTDDVDHLCFNRSCCNPGHLRALPASDNRRRTRPALATHCPRGHEYDESRNGTTGRRYCRACCTEREVQRTIRRRIARQAARRAAA